MKINATHAIAGLAVLYLVYRFGRSAGVKASTTAGAGQPGNSISDGAEWWSYAGSWGSQ